MGCCWYHKGTNFQANHNSSHIPVKWYWVVADTTKVRIFKQITTTLDQSSEEHKLLLIPQRYEFSSKSQHQYAQNALALGCCWYHKGTNFQANHNGYLICPWLMLLLLIPQRYEFSSKSQLLAYHCIYCSVVADTTKVRIFKQITTTNDYIRLRLCCCWYHKGTNFQANHNTNTWNVECGYVVADTTKVRIFKQITTNRIKQYLFYCCCWYHKGTNFQANHNKK